MRSAIRLIGFLVALLAALGLGVSTVNAQAWSGSTGTQKPAVAAQKAGLAADGPVQAVCSRFPYINGTGVNVRSAPWGRIIGKARLLERVSIGFYDGVWAFVYFRDRISPFVGYVHQAYISYPTC